MFYDIQGPAWLRYLIFVIQTDLYIGLSINKFSDVW